MKKDEELWLKKIKQSLEDYSEPVPPAAWERLEKELAARQSIPARGKQVPLHAQWWWAAAAAAVVFVAVSVIAFRLTAPDRVEEMEVPHLAVAPDVLPQPTQEDAGTRLTQQAPLPSATAAGSVGHGQWIARQQTIAPSAEEQETTTSESSSSDGDLQDVEKQQLETSGQPDLKKETVESRPARTARRTKLQLPDGYTKPKEKKGWSFGVSVGNPTGFSSGGDEAGNLMMSDGIVGAGNFYDLDLSATTNTILTIPKGQELVFENGMPYLVDEKDAVVAADHKQPISVGVSVRKELPKGFSVETGLVYTFLASDVQYAGSSSMVSQKLHYLGIPLRANWTFWENRTFTTYVAAGGTIEKCVYGKIGSETLTVDPLQFSLMGAVGAQVNLADHVGLYVEPGLSYFFDDGSDVQTIRKENPFNFTLQAGLRFTY